jgi:hypothetical protein
MKRLGTLTLRPSVRFTRVSEATERPSYYREFTLESERRCAADLLDAGAQYVAIYKERIKAPSAITDYKYIGIEAEQDARIKEVPHGLICELMEVHLPKRVITDRNELDRWEAKKSAAYVSEHPYVPKYDGELHVLVPYTDRRTTSGKAKKQGQKPGEKPGRKPERGPGAGGRSRGGGTARGKQRKSVRRRR